MKNNSHKSREFSFTWSKLISEWAKIFCSEIPLNCNKGLFKFIKIKSMGAETSALELWRLGSRRTDILIRNAKSETKPAARKQRSKLVRTAEYTQSSGFGGTSEVEVKGKLKTGLRAQWRSTWIPQNSPVWFSVAEWIPLPHPQKGWRGLFLKKVNRTFVTGEYQAGMRAGN